MSFHPFRRRLAAIRSYARPHFWFAWLVLAMPAWAADAPKISFTRQIKPILTNRCFACHGPDEQERKGELRLDLRDEAVPGVIKPGDAEHSELIVRVTSTDADLRMPPVDSKKPVLSADEIGLIRQWIDQGAEYDAHWAYVKPTKPDVPALKQSDWPINPIDNFILARLEAKGLAPAPEADKRTLLRRLSFDITGLPPTPNELADFEADTSPEAYGKVVDRLLASKHFGERMAVYWLDVVRFADSAGYHSDNHRDLAPYRDYVIDAFNNNKPFDQFTIEQLAGDLLPNATGEQRIASGYNRLLQTTEEGGAQAKEYTAKYAADRVRNTSVIWLASTMGCSECHSHKFDPFTHKDFYSFAAFFADVSEKGVGRQDQTKIPTPEQEAQAKELDSRLAGLQSEFNAETPEIAAAFAKWEETAKADVASGKNAWMVVTPAKATSKKGTEFTIQPDSIVLSRGPNPAKETYVITLPSEMSGIRGLRLDALTDDSFPNKGNSRANGNFVLTEVEVEAVAADEKAMRVKLAAEADFSQPNYPIAAAIDGDGNTGWAVAGHEKPANRTAVFTFAEPVGGPGARLTVTLKHDSQFAGHNIGKFRLSLTTAEKPSVSGGGLSVELAAALNAEAAKRSSKQVELLDAHFRSIAPELAPLRDQIAKVTQAKATLEAAYPSTLVSMSVAPRTMRILPRGNWLDESGEIVQPALPGFLNSPLSPRGRGAGGEGAEPPTGANLTRLDLARWIASQDNPLTARVFVNRLWKLAFGRGIVRTLEDFGSQGEPPTHPELLDWLALDFAENGWDVKRTLKLMLMSRAYRQSSNPKAATSGRGSDSLTLDPTNDLFSRQARYRLDAEMVRDNALAVSGLLVLKIGGPSVKPYQPAGYWQYLNFPKREWENDKGENQYRRGLYTYWQRTFLHPSLAAFDAPSREECTVERPKSNTPQQALVLLNDPTYVEAARSLAGRILSLGGETTDSRLEFAFRQVLSRSPRPEEAKVLTALLDKHRAEFAKEKESTQQFLQVGDLVSPSSLDPAELAAWTSVSRVLLNLHETITRN